MKIAAIYDVHGNLPALEAVLGEVSREDVDLVLFGGDIVPGPMPSECLELLASQKTPLRCLRGNCENEILGVADERETGRVPEKFMHVMRWSAQQLRKSQLEWIRSWPDTINIGDVLFCHATPRDDNEVFLKTTDENALLPVFENCPGLVVCGHTHMQFDRHIGKSRVVNAGSVGSPYGDPGAYWALINDDVELRKTDYDLEAAAKEIRETEYPMAEEFARESVLSPASEDTMIAAFEKIALK